MPTSGQTRENLAEQTLSMSTSSETQVKTANLLHFPPEMLNEIPNNAFSNVGHAFSSLDQFLGLRCTCKAFDRSLLYVLGLKAPVIQHADLIRLELTSLNNQVSLLVLHVTRLQGSLETLVRHENWKAVLHEHIECVPRLRELRFVVDAGRYRLLGTAEVKTLVPALYEDADLQPSTDECYPPTHMVTYNVLKESDRSHIFPRHVATWLVANKTLR